MEELIKIEMRDGIQTVSARELHEKLGIETQYKDWFPRMCEYGFKENTDFVAIAQKRATAQGNKTTYTDHYISIDMAKEICMLQRSEIGRKFRRYFIECEKKLKEVAPAVPKGRDLIVANNLLQKKISILLKKVVDTLWLQCYK